jgi:integrase
MATTDKGKRRERNRKRFDEESVLTLPAKRRQYMVWDTGTEAARGLGVLVSPTGTRSYRVVYRFPGTTKLHGLGLGRVGVISLEEARGKALEARRKAAQGIDPKGADLRYSTKFGEAIEEFVQRHLIGKRNAVTAQPIKSQLLTHFAEWKERPVSSVTATEISNLLDAIRDGNGEVRGKPYQANKLHAWLKTFFRWCARPDIGKIKASPMLSIDRPFDGEKPRDRVFSDGELVALWRAANAIGGIHGKFLKALLLTGKRKGALARMRWEHIDGNWLWTPPASESKRNKKTLPAPLSSLLQKELGKRQASGYVFEGIVESTPYDPINLPRLVQRCSKVADFFPHALRHTAETKLAELKVPPHVRDLLFDHQPQRGAGARYDHYSYGDEMRQAVELWAAYVRKLAGPKAVPSAIGT